MQNTCKALSGGGDDKNGCHQHWKIYKNGVNLSKTFFLPFRGNCFNVVFMFGGRSFGVMFMGPPIVYSRPF